MFVNGYARSVGNGALNIGVPYTEIEAHIQEETLSTGYFNDPLYKPFSGALVALFPELEKMAPREAQTWLWRHYCGLSSKERARLITAATGKSHVAIDDIEASGSLFGQDVAHDRHHLPAFDMETVARSFHAPALLRTAWYDWFLNDAFATWELLQRAAPEAIKAQCRLVIGPGAHNKLGYNVGVEKHPELLVGHLTTPEMLLRWCEAVREDETAAWPRVCYYMMGANEWRAASNWPPSEAKETQFYLAPDGGLSRDEHPPDAPPQRYIYDPENPTPTVGGSVVSWLYTPGSVDVSEVQKRPDVLTFTSEPLKADLDVAGPLRLTLYASSSVVDTDFVARLSDVFPDGRALQLQNVALRARYRDINNPELLEPGRIYQFEIDMWATANRFKAGHRLRVDISSSDFPKLDRNSNLGGAPGRSVPATQTICHDRDHPSHLTVWVLPRKPA
jgi:putative CocE/NonD family hydrolase